MSRGTITHTHMHNSNMYSQVVAMTSHEVAVSLWVSCARQTKLQSLSLSLTHTHLFPLKHLQKCSSHSSIASAGRQTSRSVWCNVHFKHTHTYVHLNSDVSYEIQRFTYSF